MSNKIKRNYNSKENKSIILRDNKLINNWLY